MTFALRGVVLTEKYPVVASGAVQYFGEFETETGCISLQENPNYYTGGCNPRVPDPPRPAP